MRHVNCNYCGRDDAELVNRGPDLYLNRDGDFRLVRCRYCGLIYQNPQLTEDKILDHYPLEHYELYATVASEDDSALQRAARQHGLARRYRQVMRHVLGPGSVLDVGCATGSFLEMMRSHGWQVTGVELNPDAARYAREELDLDVRTGTLEQARFQTDSFDAVTMWDVFEHVLDPRATLLEVGRILKPGGLLALSLPNPESLEARLFGESWIGWDRPRHLHLFPPSLMRRYLKDAGFFDVQIESRGGRLKVTLMSVGCFLNARQVAEERWSPWVNALYNWPLRLLTWPFYRLAEHFNQTTIMMAFAIWRQPSRNSQS